jgi:hypothetical protein
MADAPYEFDCAECGRHIVAFVRPSDAALCAACLHLPGWYRDVGLRRRLDPEHDGKETWERTDGRL